MNNSGRFSDQLRLTLKSLSPYKKKISILLGISLLEALTASFGIILIIPFLDIAMGTQSDSFLNKLLLPLAELAPRDYQVLLLASMMLLLMAIKCTLSILNKYLATSFSLRLSEQWSNQLHECYLRRRFDLSARQKHGEVLNNITDEPPIAAKYLTSVIEYGSQIILSMVMVTVLLVIDWQVTLGLGLIGSFLWIGLSRILHPYTRTLGQDRMHAQQAVLIQASENISGQTIVKAFSLLDRVQNNFKAINAYKRRIIIRFRMINAALAPMGEFLVFSTIIFIVFATTRFEPGRIQARLPSITALVICGQQLIRSLSFLMANALGIIFRLPAIRMVHEAIHQSHLHEESYTGQIFTRLQTDLCLKQVSFSYDDENFVFQDLDLVFPIGKMSAIIGPSGIGKSTIIHLLMGLLKPTQGKILVNNKPLVDYQLDSWRQRIGYVGQDPFLFHGTIRDNIRMGRQDASDLQIEDAARAAAIHDFIVSQPNGYNTMVGDRGVTVSGGQKQRISIARAIVRDPDLYLFDEATSALDHESEQLIQQAMQRLSQSKTVIVVAHRMTTIENADVVYDLSKLQHNKIHIVPSALTTAHH